MVIHGNFIVTSWLLEGHLTGRIVMNPYEVAAATSQLPLLPRSYLAAIELRDCWAIGNRVFKAPNVMRLHVR